MSNLPVKSEQSSVNEVSAAILSFSDPNIIANVFASKGWTFTEEIKETLSVVHQNVNLAAKMTALKHMRSLVKEAAEAAGLVAKVSRTIPGPGGEQTTFSANRIAMALNPVKQVENTQISEREKDVKEEKQETIVDGGSTETENRETGGCSGYDSKRGEGVSGIEDNKLSGRGSAGSDGEGDSDSGSERCVGGGEVDGEDSDSAGNNSSPCVQHRPPTCDPKLFPGVGGGGDSADNNP